MQTETQKEQQNTTDGDENDTLDKESNTPQPEEVKESKEETGVEISCDEPDCDWKGTYPNASIATGSLNLHKKKAHGKVMPKISKTIEKPKVTAQAGPKKKFIAPNPETPHENQILTNLYNAGIPEEKHNAFLVFLREGEPGQMEDWRWHKQCLKDAYISGQTAEMYLKLMFPKFRNKMRSDGLQDDSEISTSSMLKEELERIRKEEEETKLIEILKLKRGRKSKFDDDDDDDDGKKKTLRKFPDGVVAGRYNDKEWGKLLIEWYATTGNRQDEDDDDDRKKPRVYPDGTPAGKFKDKEWADIYMQWKFMEQAQQRMQQQQQTSGNRSEYERLMEEKIRLQQDMLTKDFKERFDRIESRLGRSDFERYKDMQEEAKRAGIPVDGNDARNEMEKKQLETKLKLLENQYQGIQRRMDDIVDMAKPFLSQKIKKTLREDNPNPPVLRSYTQADYARMNQNLKVADEEEGDEYERRPAKAKGKGRH